MLQLPGCDAQYFYTRNLVLFCVLFTSHMLKSKAVLFPSASSVSKQKYEYMASGNGGVETG